MNSNLTRWRHLIATASIVVIGLMTGPVAQVYAQNSNPGVVPPHANAYGMTYGE
jgi:hypothetical protein